MGKMQSVVVRIKVAGRAKPLVKRTGFTVYDDPEVTLKRGLEIIEQERVNAHGYNRTRKTIPTLKQFHAEYVKQWPHPDENRRNALQRLEGFVKEYGHLPIDEISEDLCSAWVDKCMDPERVTHRCKRAYAPGTMNSIGTQLRSMFKHAVGKGKPLVENPWAKVKLPKASVCERVLLEGELERIVGFLQKQPEMYRQFLFVLNTGLRRNEYTYIRSNDIRGQLITVRKEIAKLGKERLVGIPLVILAIVNAQRKARGIGEGSQERLWTGSQERLRRAIHAACRAAGIEEKLTPHDLRRSFATIKSESLTLKELMMALGHSRPTVTVRHYAIAEKQAVADRLAGIVRPKRNAGDAILPVPTADATNDATTDENEGKVLEFSARLH
jgi:integrase